ncbi:MAG: rhodanese-like domain-containing protein [Acidobacteriota bacterium]
MPKTLKSGVLFAVACCLLASPTRSAAQGITRHLVDVRWLEQHLNDPDVLVLDASLPPAYGAAHIPGAVNVNAFVYGGRELPVAEAEKMYQSWGISPTRTLVLYDPGGSFMATRLFFSLYYHGFPPAQLTILDGGLAKWREAGLPVTKEVPPAPRTGTFTIAQVNEGVRVRLPEVLNASGDPAHHVLLEALGADWHFGQTQPFDRGGHIPNGILLPSADLYNSDKTFKSPDELRRILRHLGIGPERPVYTYCGGGVAASAPFFALKFLLDYPTVKLYAESELGYLSDERRLPYWTYDAPYLLRDSRWLQWKGGQMLRMYVSTEVSIVDVRPAELYAAGHVPYAVSVPAGVFRTHLADAAALAERLGAAGVDASLEAVVVSGAGLTPDAALAFVALEAIGQKRVSVLIDPADRWAAGGLMSTTAPTIVGSKRSPQDLAVDAKPYAAHARPGVVISDPVSTTGLYPKVFVAAGTVLPATMPDGKVAHVPYSDLLNADGTPKAAKDIWSILTKAGVPRYAELVCVSDDPGEAAVAYLILKLMGYPDVKVLIK